MVSAMSSLIVRLAANPERARLKRQINLNSSMSVMAAVHSGGYQSNC